MSDPRGMSVKELKAAIVSLIGEAALAAKKFVEKSEFIEYLIQQQKALKAKKDGITIVPAGSYILGDPCFAVTDVLHLEKFNETYYDSEEEDEEVSHSKPKAKPAPAIREARFDESTVVTAFNTFSDGPTWFAERKGKRSWLINAGVIALVPLSYNPSFSVDDDVAHIVSFDSPSSCFAKRGVIHFGDIEIDTRKPTNRSSATREAPKVRSSGKRKARSRVEEDSEIEEESGSEELEEESFSGSISDDSGDNWVPETPERKKRRKQVIHESSSDEAEFDE